MHRVADDKDMLRKVMESLKLNSLFSSNKIPTPIYRYQSVQQKSKNDIDHDKTTESRALQLSNYVAIENDYKILRKKYMLLKGGDFTDKYELEGKLSEMQNWNGKLHLRYCHERDVQRKRFVFLRFKARMLQMWKHLQLNGQCVNVLTKLEQWIDENMDDLIEEFVSSHGESRLAKVSRNRSTKTPPGFVTA